MDQQVQKSSEQPAQVGALPSSRPMLGEPEVVDTSALSLAWRERALLSKAETLDPREHAKTLRKSVRRARKAA